MQVSFPKLNRKIWNEKLKAWLISGKLDICDTSGEYWDTFEIALIVPNTYPYCVPKVWELSEKIPRSEERHIDKNGICCVDIEHRLLQMSRKGIKLIDFVTKKVYPYFANQIYYEEKEKYANGEYGHYFNGTIQFYEEEYFITDKNEAVLILENILSGKLPTNNEICFCGKDKYKRCHKQTVISLKSVGEKQLKNDLKNFKKN